MPRFGERGRHPSLLNELPTLGSAGGFTLRQLAPFPLEFARLPVEPTSGCNRPCTQPNGWVARSRQHSPTYVGTRDFGPPEWSRWKNGIDQLHESCP